MATIIWCFPISSTFLRNFLFVISIKMHGRCPLSSSFLSNHCSIVNAGSHLASLNETEPQRLHDVNKDLWQRTFLSVMGNEHDKSPTLNIFFGLHGNSLPILNPESLPQPQHDFPSPNSPNHYNSASPPQPAITGPELKSESNQDATPTQVQSPRYVNWFAAFKDFFIYFWLTPDDAVAGLSHVLIVALMPPIVDTTWSDTERRGTEKYDTAIKSK